MATLRHILEIHAPLEKVYQAWANFPELLAHFDLVLESTAPESDLIQITYKGLLGRTLDLTLEITEQLPQRVIAWKMKEGAVPLAGSVMFEEAGEDTFVTFVFSFDPPFVNLGDLVTKVLEFPSAGIVRGLEKLTRSIEES